MILKIKSRIFAVYVLLVASSMFAFSASSKTIGIGNNAHIGFQENVGQFVEQNHRSNSNVLYGMALPGMNISLLNNGFSYTTYKESVTNKDDRGTNQNSRSRVRPKSSIAVHRVDVVFLGANKNCKITTAGATEDTRTYIVDGHPLKSRSFHKVTYLNLYPNIDLEFVSNSSPTKPVEYNFIIHKGGRVSDIRMNYRGALDATITEGKLNLKLIHGTLTESIPASWYQESMETENINYSIVSKRQGDVVVQLLKSDAHNDTNKTLIVDPVPELDWATYFGGSNLDFAVHVSEDKHGNLYLTGGTESTDLVHTSGAYQTTLQGAVDAYVCKFNKKGERLWSTFFGGNGLDYGVVGAIDLNNNYYLAGRTESDAFLATTGAHQSKRGGDEDGFVAKFSESGNLLWCTYIGGSSFESLNCMASDRYGNIYIGGQSYSTDNIGTSGTHQALKSDTLLPDGFLVKFNDSGNRIWGTYFGGSDFEQITSCAVDSSGNCYVSFNTNSTSNISTVGSHQESIANVDDAGIAKFNPNGGLIWATYYGGDDFEYGLDIQVDFENNVIMSGFSASDTGISTTGAFEESRIQFEDYFAAKFDENGNRLWGTYLGLEKIFIGGQGEMRLDIFGNIYFSLAPNPDFVNPKLISSDALKKTQEGVDGIILKLNKDGDFRWGTYFGDEGDEIATSILVDSVGDIFIFGEAADTFSGIATSGAYQTVNKGDDIYFAKLTQEDYVVLREDTSACDSIMLNGNVYRSSTFLNARRSNVTCCDTLVITKVTINGSTNGSVNTSACGSVDVNGFYYTETGTYTQTIPNSNGCDSIISVDVTITPTGLDAGFVIASQLITNNEVSVVNISQETPDSSTWILPNTSSIKIIEESPEQLLLEFADSGTYTLALRTYQGLCSQYASKDIVVLKNRNIDPVAGKDPFIKTFNIYPNPSDGNFTTEVELSAVSDIHLRVVDLTTSAVLDDQTHSGADTYTINYTLNIQSGVYVMLLETARGNLILRFVVQ